MLDHASVEFVLTPKLKQISYDLIYDRFWKIYVFDYTYSDICISIYLYV